MDSDMRPAVDVWHAVYHPVNVESFLEQMRVFDRIREINLSLRQIPSSGTLPS